MSGRHLSVSGNCTGPDGKPLRQNGLSVALLRRGQDGQWRLVIDNPFGDRLLHAR